MFEWDTTFLKFLIEGFEKEKPTPLYPSIDRTTSNGGGLQQHLFDLQFGVRLTKTKWFDRLKKK